MRKHMQRKHPNVQLDVDTRPSSEVPENLIVQQTRQPENAEASTSCAAALNATPSASGHSGPSFTQTRLTAYTRRKLNVSATKKIDEALMKLFIEDYQPFSIVEDSGFRKFVTELNPSYQLPSRKTISTVLLPALFEDRYNDVKIQLKDVLSVTLTTDCWTSLNNESFLAVTAHYINSNFNLCSTLLECKYFHDAHTSENLALKKGI